MSKDKQKCKVCGCKTETVFNIGFKATPICEGCARSIFIQQAMWYVNTEGSNPMSSEDLIETNK